jgi:hypothetical protein
MKKIFTKNKIVTFLLLALFLFILNLNLKQNKYKKNFKINKDNVIDNDSILKSIHEIDSIINDVHLKNEEKDSQILKLKNVNKNKKIIKNKKEELNYDVEPVLLKVESKIIDKNLIIINDTIVNTIYIYDTIKKIQIDTIVYKKEDIKKNKIQKKTIQLIFLHK